MQTFQTLDAKLRNTLYDPELFFRINLNNLNHLAFQLSPLAERFIVHELL